MDSAYNKLFEVEVRTKNFTFYPMKYIHSKLEKETSSNESKNQDLNQTLSEI